MKKAGALSILLVMVLLAVAVVAKAQQPKKVPRIAYLSGNFPSSIAARTEAFRQGLRELGYVEGKNIVIEYRYGEGKLERLPTLAAELVRLKADVIVTVGPASTRPAKEATVAIPIVMAQVNDPVGQWVCRQSCATGREHYWIVNPCPGDKRKTTGASERDRS
jgi:putative tryptophan/tyrosine transport system substrate-binding protein